ncbi:MAG: CocE/NonD family hydrolase C-terminal non-catalytic domain-containing protein [Haloechinothrix sp.]
MGAVSAAACGRLPALAGSTQITGPLAAKLWVSASTPDADLFLSVRVYDENGDEKLFRGMPDPNIPLTQGWLRASQRELDETRTLPYRPFLTHKTVKPLWPGEVYELDIEIHPACVVLPAGYRLGLTVQGQDFEHDAEPFEWGKTGLMMRGSSNETHDDPLFRPANIYDNDGTIHSGPGRESHLLIPIIPAS